MGARSGVANVYPFVRGVLLRGLTLPSHRRDTAQALYQQAADQLQAGTTASIDVLRAQVELQTRKQQLISARNDLAKQRIALARVIGSTDQEFTLTDTASYEPAPKIGLSEALSLAYNSRADYQSALAQVRAATGSQGGCRQLLSHAFHGG